MALSISPPAKAFKLWNNTHFSPLEIYNAFLHIMEFLETADIVHSAKVCKLWNAFIKESPSIWKGLFKKEGIPLVNGKDRDYREDFITLFPMTISGRKIGEVFGKIIGQIPEISEQVFNKLNEGILSKAENSKETSQSSYPCG